MRRLVRIALFSVGLLGGCSTIMGLERPERVDENSGGDGAVAGRDGDAAFAGRSGGSGSPDDGGAAGSSDAGASATGRAGEAGHAGVSDGSSGNSGERGHGGRGEAGEHGGLGGEGGRADAGDAGQSGSGPSGPFLGGPCDVSGAYACSDFEPNLVLACSEGYWKIDEACGTGSLCDRELRECRAVQDPCVAREDSFCLGDFELAECRNPFVPVLFQCPFGCEAGRCLPGTGDELVVHTELVPWNASAERWREPIDVCFHDGGEDQPLVSVIRDEVERGWGRLLDVEFTGWDECTGDEDTRRVELAFRDECELRLGSGVPDGAPPAGEARTVEFCRTYYTAAGELETLLEHDALFRYVARHQFGHVLGSRDDDHTLQPTVMRRSLHESDAAGLQISSVDVAPYRFDYGQKPMRSLITETGACLSPTLLGFYELACSNSKAGFFDFVGSEVSSLGAGVPGCFSVPPGDGAVVGLGECGAPSGRTELRFTHARWSTPNRCVAPKRTESGSPLWASPCGAVGDPAQSWWFEILASADDRQAARIRFAATGECLGLDEPVQVGAIPRLEPCDDDLEDDSELFMLWENGMISHFEGEPGTNAALCVQWDAPDGVLYLHKQCTAYTYWIFGALETPDGRLLSFTQDDEVEQLSAVSRASGALPLPNQIFGLTF